MSAIGLPGGDSAAKAIGGAGATVATAIFVNQMLTSVGQTMDKWKKCYGPHMSEEIGAINKAYGRLVESGLETKETQDKFFGMEPLEADGKVLGMVPMWLPPIGCIPWDHERWHKFIDSNGPWYGRLATLLSRICQWQLSRMTGADLDMFRFAKKKRANDPLNLLCEELKTWLVAMHSKADFLLIRHLEHRIQFLLSLRLEKSSLKTQEASKNIIGSRGTKLVFDYQTAQLLVELEYRLHNFLADVYHRVNRAGIGMCFDLLTVRFRIAYEQMVYYLYYLLNAENHGLAPSDKVNNVTRLKNPMDQMQGRAVIDIELMKATPEITKCANAGRCEGQVDDGHELKSNRLACMALGNQRARLLTHLVKLGAHEVLGVPAPPPQANSRVMQKATAPQPNATPEDILAAKEKQAADTFLIGPTPVIPLRLARKGNRYAIGAYFMQTKDEEDKAEEARLAASKNVVGKAIGGVVGALDKVLGKPAPVNATGLPLTLLWKLEWQRLPRESRSYKLPNNSVSQVCMKLLAQPLRPLDYHLILQHFIEAHGYLLLLRRASIILDGMNAAGKEHIYSLMNDQFVQFLHCAKKACTHLLSTCDQLQLDVARFFGEVFSDRSCNDQLFRTEFDNWRRNFRHANSLWSSQAPNRAQPLDGGNLQSADMQSKESETLASIEMGDGIAENLRVMITQLDAVAQFAAKDQAEELKLHQARAALVADQLDAFVKNNNADVLPPDAATVEANLIAQAEADQKAKDALPPPPVLLPIAELLRSYGFGGSLRLTTVRSAIIGTKVKTRPFFFLDPKVDADAMESFFARVKYCATPQWKAEQQKLTEASAMTMFAMGASQQHPFILLTTGSRVATWSVEWSPREATKDEVKKEIAGGHWPKSHVEAFNEDVGKSHLANMPDGPAAIAAARFPNNCFTLTWKLANPACNTKLDLNGSWFLAASAEQYPQVRSLLEHFQAKK